MAEDEQVSILGGENCGPSTRVLSAIIRYLWRSLYILKPIANELDGAAAGMTFRECTNITEAHAFEISILSDDVKKPAEFFQSRLTRRAWCAPLRRCHAVCSICCRADRFQLDCPHFWAAHICPQLCGCLGR